jgi:hypothetical protein
VVWDRLCDLRGTDPAIGRQQLTPERELVLLDKDFQAGGPELEAWSMVYLRYLASAQVSVREVAERLDASHKTLMRRTTRGYELLAEALRAR